jgi:hypothetical protein
MKDYLQILTTKRLMEASEVMGALQVAFGKLDLLDEAAKKRSVLASVKLKQAQLSLTATAYHMHHGQELHGALMTTLYDEMMLTLE